MIWSTFLDNVLFVLDWIYLMVLRVSLGLIVRRDSTHLRTAVPGFLVSSKPRML